MDLRGAHMGKAGRGTTILSSVILEAAAVAPKPEFLVVYYFFYDETGKICGVSLQDRWHLQISREYATCALVVRTVV